MHIYRRKWGGPGCKITEARQSESQAEVRFWLPLLDARPLCSKRPSAVYSGRRRLRSYEYPCPLVSPAFSLIASPASVMSYIIWSTAPPGLRSQPVCSQPYGELLRYLGRRRRRSPPEPLQSNLARQQAPHRPRRCSTAMKTTQVAAHRLSSPLFQWLARPSLVPIVSCQGPRPYRRAVKR
jgi:hypothetical protein